MLESPARQAAGAWIVIPLFTDVNAAMRDYTSIIQEENRQLRERARAPDPEQREALSKVMPSDSGGERS
jgi:hypothetical protein